MTIQAVAVMQTICRDEFERDWNGFEDPFDFIRGEPWSIDGAPPVAEIIVEVDGKSYVFPSADVVNAILSTQEHFRYEAEEEIEEMDEDERYRFGFDEDAVIAEKVDTKVNEYWFSQLDNAEEALAVVGHRLDYVVKGFQELVETFNMIGERQPSLRPVMAEKLQAAHDDMVAQLQALIDQADD